MRKGAVLAALVLLSACLFALSLFAGTSDLHDPALRNRYVQEMRRNHVLALSCGNRTTRLRPMLDIERQHIQLYLDAAAKSLHAITK